MAAQLTGALAMVNAVTSIAWCGVGQTANAQIGNAKVMLRNGETKRPMTNNAEIAGNSYIHKNGGLQAPLISHPHHPQDPPAVLPHVQTLLDRMIQHNHREALLPPAVAPHFQFLLGCLVQPQTLLDRMIQHNHREALHPPAVAPHFPFLLGCLVQHKPREALQPKPFWMCMARACMDLTALACALYNTIVNLNNAIVILK